MSRYRLDTHVIARLATSLLIVAGLLIVPTGCFLVPADSDAQLGSGNNHNRRRVQHDRQRPERFFTHRAHRRRGRTGRTRWPAGRPG